jgi:hypothetical protein
MSIDYSKLPDGHIAEGIELLSSKLREAKCFMAEVTKAHKQLMNQGYPPRKRVKGQVQFFDLPLEKHAAWSAMMGVYKLRIESLRQFIVEMRLLLLRLKLEQKSRGTNDD